MQELHLKITPLQRILIIIAVMTATLMQVLDITIVNVALPYMQGSLEANPDQISWTLTSYLVASAIFMPLTGYLSDKLGMKNYLLWSMLGFTITSALCGFSRNLAEIVIFRLLQGAFGAPLIPLTQALLISIFPKEQRAKAMAIWGFGVMVGPILGPTLGGYLTEVANWRFTFFVNVPFGIFALLLAWQVVPDFAKKHRLMDWLGLTFISLAIAALQYFLDRGNDEDWFNAWDIRIAALLCLAGFIAFLVHNAFKPERRVFDLRIFKDRNFSLASILIAMMGLGMFGVMVIQPLMLETLFNYPVLTTGLVMAPRGIAGMVGMIFMGKYGQRIDPRYSVIIGVLLSVVGINAYTHLSLDVGPMAFIWPLLLQGFSVSMIFTALSTIAFSTLPPQFIIEGSGLFSLLRTLGSSIGISLTVAVYTHEGQVLWNQLGGFINPYNPAAVHYLNSLQLHTGDPLGQQILGLTLMQQSQMLAYVNTFDFIMWSFVVMVPLALLIKKPRRTQASHVVAD
jgi:MFS transporter, DHA2 family, multidrug resistance protein